MMNNPAVIIVLIAVAIGVIVYFSRRHSAFELVVHAGKISKHRGLTKRQYHEAEDFFAKHFADTPQIRITGFAQGNRIRYRISGDVDAGQTQQIRNFLTDIG